MNFYFKISSNIVLNGQGIIQNNNHELVLLRLINLIEYRILNKVDSFPRKRNVG